MIDEHAWRNEYKKLCRDLLGMTKPQAESHYQNAPVFDYGYSPIWYIEEEINCGFIKKKGAQCE